MPALLGLLFCLHSGVPNLERIMGEIVLGHSGLIKHGVSALGFDLRGLRFEV